MLGQVYIVYCEANEKIYVGQTIKDLKLRWRQHCKPSTRLRKGRSSVFAHAIHKYGKQNFLVQSVSEAVDKEQLDNLEKVWVLLFRSSENKFGYNRTLGGDGSLTEESRQLMRVKRPGTSKKLRGRKRPAHVMAILRASNIGRKQSKEQVAARVAAIAGSKHSPEAIVKMKVAKLLYWMQRKSASRKFHVCQIGRVLDVE